MTRSKETVDKMSTKNEFEIIPRIQSLHFSEKKVGHIRPIPGPHFSLVNSLLLTP